MSRIEKEKVTVRHMIEIWCRHHHASGRGLCPECQELLDYATVRLDHCKFGEHKTNCHDCPVHCYKKDMRERIRAVMRYAGPRMILYHPVEAVRYLFNMLLMHR